MGPGLWTIAQVLVPLAVGAAVLSMTVRPPSPRAPVAPVTPTTHAAPRFPGPGIVEMRGPASDPTIAAKSPDGPGRDVRVACASCHTTRPPDLARRTTEGLLEFHQGAHLAHGGLACVACHAPPRYDALRLADGALVPYVEVMRLCSQCHGPQRRDYDHGAHGGMAGYWDLAKGGRIRNGCTECHAPHAPRYPTFAPARGPNDRFPPASHGDHGAHDAAPGPAHGASPAHGAADGGLR